MIVPILFLIVMATFSTKKFGLFSQQRVGRNAKLFLMYKIRTMTGDHEGTDIATLNRSRITSFGKILRSTNLDELPQLFNVLRGEMSLVGPRPPIPSEVDQYETWQRRRLSMKPGLTCIWQVSGRNDIDFKTWMKMDLAYIDKWSIWLDLKLLFLTIPTVLFGTGR